MNNLKTEGELFMYSLKKNLVQEDLEKKFNMSMLKIYIFKFIISFHIFSAVIIPFFTEWVRISLLEIMFLQSWCMLWVFLSEVPTGAIADKFGRKLSIQLGIVAQIIGFSIYVLFPNFIVYLFAEMILGISISLMSGADEAFIYDTLKNYNKEHEAKKIFGRTESFMFLGIMTAAPIGSYISGIWGSQITFLLMIIPLTISLIITMFLKEPVREKKAEEKKYIAILKDGVKAFGNNKVLKILTFDTVLICTIGFLFIWLYQVILLDIGLEIEYLGIVNTAFVALEIVLLNTYSRIEKILKSKKRLLFISNILIGVSIIVVALVKIKIVIIICLCIALGLAMTRNPLMISYMNKYIDSEHRATVISTISMIISFIRMVTFPFIGYIGEKNLKLTLCVLGIVVVSFAFYSKIEEKHLV